MAKTIKFNLICDDKPVRTLEDLQNNFSVEDVLAYYNNQLLHRWLEVRNYSKELEKVNAIIAEKPIEIVKELIKIFDIINDEKKIEESVYMLEYTDERKELCNIYSSQNYKTKAVIDDYETGYRQLVDGILENPNDIAKIKANISEIVTNYEWVFRLNNRELFWLLKDKSFLAIMCLLMNQKSRKYYLPILVKEKVDSKSESNMSESLTSSSKFFPGISKITIPEYYEEDECYDTEFNDDKREIYSEVCSLITTTEFKTTLADDLSTFAGITDGYWKDLEPKGKKYMIISMGSGDFVRSAGVSGGDLASSDVNNKFMIVDGIDYKSNSATRQLLYMEV